jgi:hypothetical protein
MHAVRRTLAVSPLLFLTLSGVSPAVTQAEEPKPKPAEVKEARAETPSSPVTPVTNGGKLTIAGADGKNVACREQTAQSFLIRGNWFPKSNEAEKVKEGRKLLEDAIKYRTEKYGYFEGFGSPKLNAHPPKHYAKSTTFMGMTVQVHERIIPALKCVEAALKAGPAANEYHPRAMGGIRFHNTYKGVEISNHVYGIAVDIEPDRNTCCGCVAPWNENPVCKDKSKTTVWQRMVMPKSWVDTFERFGFYWLGHDVLQDTMHFEFLGDPDKIVEAPSTVAAN